MRKRDVLKRLAIEDPMYRIWLQRRRAAKLDMVALSAGLYHVSRHPELGDLQSILRQLDHARDLFNEASARTAEYRTQRRRILKDISQ